MCNWCLSSVVFEVVNIMAGNETSGNHQGGFPIYFRQHSPHFRAQLQICAATDRQLNKKRQSTILAFGWGVATLFKQLTSNNTINDWASMQCGIKVSHLYKDVPFLTFSLSQSS